MPKLYEKLCKECGDEFPTYERRKVFCTRSCAAKYNNKLRDTKPMKNCTWDLCNLTFQDKGTKQEFCSTECRRFHYYFEWFWGRWSPEGELPKWLRYHVLESVDGCSRCGWNEINPTSGRSTLQFDHINGMPYDNRYENIRILCPNCHSLTPTYGNLNRGNGRSNRYSDVV